MDKMDKTVRIRKNEDGTFTVFVNNTSSVEKLADEGVPVRDWYYTGCEANDKLAVIESIIAILKEET